MHWRTLAVTSLAALALAGGGASPAWAGAWTVPRNRWYAEYFSRYFGAKHDFDARGNSGRKPKTAVFRDIRHEWKLEYGLTDRVNLLASVPYQSSHYRDDNTDLLNTGVGDVYVRTKLRLSTAPAVSSLQFSWKIPSAYDPNVSPALGDGQVDFDSRVLISKAFLFAPYHVPRRRPRAARAPPSASLAEPRSRDQAIEDAVQQARGWADAVMPQAEAAVSPPAGHAQDAPVPETAGPVGEDAEWELRYAGVAFVNLESGFTARNEEPANEIPLIFEAGFTPLSRVMLVGSLDNVFSVKSTHEFPEEWVKVGLRAIVNVWGEGFANVFREGAPTVNLEVGYTDIVEGRNTADAFEVFGKVGVFF